MDAEILQPFGATSGRKRPASYSNTARGAAKKQRADRRVAVFPQVQSPAT